MKEIKSIAVIGAGKMGHGIALTSAMAGFETLLIDISKDILKEALITIEKQLMVFKEKGRINDDEKAKIVKKINTSEQYGDAKDIDFIIESVSESLNLKKEVFSELDLVCKKEAFIVSNTSSFSITEIASATKRPEKVAGMHFFIPPTKLVEIIRGYYTNNETIETAKSIALKMGKVVIEVRKDAPGFIANRIFTPLLYEAMRVYEEGLASIEEIDLAMKSSYLPVGPFELADTIGLDVLLSGWEYFNQELGPNWMPPRSLKQLVKAGRLGRKTKRGWYDY